MSIGITNKAGIRILCLDGGNSRCLSELKILEEFMSRVKQDTGNSPRPCEFFYHMTGVGAGGVIAILLGRLCMTVDAAINAFCRICSAVFNEEIRNTVDRSRALEEVSEDILKELGIPEDERFRGEIITPCKVSICHALSSSMNTCRMLHSFTCGHPSYNPTILEAIRVTWATPGLFLPTKFGPYLMEEEFTSAVNGFNNPTLEAIRDANEVYGGELRVSCLLSIGSGKQAALSVDSSDLMERAPRETDNVARELQRRLGKQDTYFRFSVEHGLESEEFNQTGELGRIISHTTIYLGDLPTSDLLDECVRASKRAGVTSLADLLSFPSSISKSRCGLPPLFPLYVTREEPMKAIIQGLLGNTNAGQRIMVISALSGSGKTQLAIKFARDNADMYDHILFVDATSAENLRDGIVRHVASLDPLSNPTTISEALGILAEPPKRISRRWLLILDGADDNNLDPNQFLPACDHGSILITTQNRTLGFLSPNSHLLLDAMTPKEANDTLLATALNPSDKPSSLDLQYAKHIAQHLGNLPLAMVQAGCYIRMQNCFSQYLDRLQENRHRLLRHPAPVQRGIPSSKQSIYAAFDATLNALSCRSLQVLSMLSFVHFSNFPRCVITLAASFEFVYEPYDLDDRGQDFEASILLLKEMFFTDGSWNVQLLDDILEELQQYSLVTQSLVHNVVTLQFHPLLHAWAHDRLSADDRYRYQAAAVRLLLCVTNPDNSSVWELLTPHLRRLSLPSSTFHVNDWAASLPVVYSSNGDSDRLVAGWAAISQILKATHGEEHIRSTRAALELAAAYWKHGESLRGEGLARRIVRIRTRTLGEDDPETVDALACLARGLRQRNKLVEAKELLNTVLCHHIRLLGDRHRLVATDNFELGLCHIAVKGFKTAEALMLKAIDIQAPLLGRSHQDTLRSILSLADCYERQHKPEKAETLREEALTLRQTTHGSSHVKTLNAMELIATSFCEKGRLSEAEEVYIRLVRGRREALGESHKDTLKAITCLAEVLSAQKANLRAEPLWREVVNERRKVFGQRHRDTLYSLRWLAEVVHQQGRPVDSESLWREVFSGRRTVFGSFHELTLDALGWLATSLSDQGRLVEAEQYWREIIERKALVKKSQKSHLPVWSGQGQSADARLRKVGMAVSGCHLRYSADAQLTRRPASHTGSISQPQSDYIQTVNRMTIQNSMLPGTFWSDVGGSRELLSSLPSKVRNADDELAEVLSRLGKYSEGEVRWRRVEEERLKALGDTHPDTLRGVYRLGEALEHLGHIEEAKHHYERAAKIQRKVLGTGSESTLDTLSALARISFKQSRFFEAQIAYREVTDCTRQVFGSSHLKTLDALYRLSNSMDMQILKYPAASEILLMTHERREHLGTEYEVIFNAARSLAQACNYHSGKCKAYEKCYQEAKELYFSLVDYKPQSFEEFQVKTLEPLFGLGSMLYRHGDYIEAEHVYSHVIKQRESLLGEGHPGTLAAWSALGDLFRIKGQLSEAKIIYRRVFAARSQFLRPFNKDLLEPLSKLGDICDQQQSYEEAEEIHAHLLRGRRLTLGAQHEDSLKSLYSLASAVHHQRRYSEAEQLWQELIDRRKVMLGEDHADTLDAIRRLTESQQAQERSVARTSLLSASTATDSIAELWFMARMFLYLTLGIDFR